MNERSLSIGDLGSFFCIIKRQFQCLKVQYSITIYMCITFQFAHPIVYNFHHQKTESFQIKILIFFFISAQNIDCGYSLEPPRRGGSN